VHVNDSDLCTVGINLSTQMGIIWRRGKTNINRLLGNAPPGTDTAHESTCRLPYELVEMIIAHIARDLDALKTCSLTCRSWHTAVVPRLHHTLTLRDDEPTTTRGELKPLSELHQLGLMLFIREIRVEQTGTWFGPQAFSPRDLGHFSAFTNVQTLTFQRLDISRFMPDIGRYFGHFSPALRSIKLLRPVCSPRELSHFLSLFSKLDNIKIWDISAHLPDITIPDTELVPLSTPRLQGWLVLYDCRSVEACTRLVTLGGGLRFYHMDLCRIGDCAPVLFKACAETLEVLRFYAGDASDSE
jgi:hypothetical protein